jgi:hypothetical protein
VSGHVPPGWTPAVWALMWTIRYVLAFIILLYAILFLLKAG